MCNYVRLKDSINHDNNSRTVQNKWVFIKKEEDERKTDFKGVTAENNNNTIRKQTIGILICQMVNMFKNTVIMRSLKPMEIIYTWKLFKCSF